MTVAVVGFPGLGWAEIAAGIRTAAVSQTFSAVCFIVFLLNFVARQASFTRSVLTHIWTPSDRRLPELPEKGTDVAGERLRLFERGEMAARLHVGPAADVWIRAFHPGPRRMQDL